MNCIRKFGTKTLDIRLGISDDPQTVDEMYKITDSSHYKVLKAKHRRTMTVNVKVEGEANKVEFEHEGNQDTEWCCEFDIPPKYKDGVRYITDCKYKSARLHHDSPGDQDRIGTTVRSKNIVDPVYDNDNCRFSVELE